MGSFNAVKAAKSVTKVIRENSEFGENSCLPSQKTKEALSSSGMLSLWRPEILGGHECDPVSYTKAAEIIATADTSAAWIMHGVSASWLVLRSATNELVDEIINSAETPLLTDTYNKAMKADRIPGGYSITGETPFASGCKIADWIAHTALYEEKLLLVFHPANTLEIRNDWNPIGIRGSASNTVAAKDIFVPEHRVIDLSIEVVPTLRFGGALYRMPTAILPIGIAAVSLGALKASLDTLAVLSENRIPFASSDTLKYRTLSQLHFGRALATYRAARNFLHYSAQQIYDQAVRGEKFDKTAKADIVLAGTYAMQTCADAVRETAKAAGTASIHKGNNIERALRDVEVTSHHAFGSEGRYASVAQAYWGLDVDFPLLGID